MQTSIRLERKCGVSFLDRQLVEFGKAAGTLERFAEPFYYFYNDDSKFTLRGSSIIIKLQGLPFAYLDFKAFQKIILRHSVRSLLLLSVAWIKSKREKESSGEDLRIWYRYGQIDSMTLTFYANCRRNYPKGYVEAPGAYLPYRALLFFILST